MSIFNKYVRYIYVLLVIKQSIAKLSGKVFSYINIRQCLGLRQDFRSKKSLITQRREIHVHAMNHKKLNLILTTFPYAVFKNDAQK